jgi:prepilin-type N-terminal cleavage/methylation domain-containing protein
MRRRRRKGFSLLEVMIALAVISLMVAFVAPNLSAGVERMSRRAALLDLDVQTRAARLASIRTGAPATLDADTLTAPPGWTLGVERAGAITPDGACASARATLSRTDRDPLPVRLSAETCRWSPA